MLLLAAGLITYHLRTLDIQLVATQRERDRAQALASYFSELFQSANPAAADRGEVSASALLESSVEALRKDADRPAETRATLLLAAADALVHLGRSAPARDAAALAVELLDTVPGADPALRARAHSELASQMHRSGDLAGATREITRAQAFVAAAGLAQSTDLALIITQQAAIYAEDSGNVAAAQAAYERVLALTRPQLAKPEHLRSHLAAHINLGLAEMDRSQPALAEARLRDALALAARHGYSDPNDILPMRTYYARTLYEQRRLEAAREVMEPTLEQAREWYGKDEPWLGLILSHAATEAMLGGRHELAAVLYHDSARRARRNYPDDHPVHWAIRGDRALGLVLAGPKHFDEARRELEAALAWRAARGNGDSPAARFDRLALAWMRCVSTPDDSAARAEVRERHAAGREVFKGWKRWLAEDWSQACR